MIYNPYNNKFIHFGAFGYLDYTKYLQLYDLKTVDKHRSRYLKRALNIKGDWRKIIHIHQIICRFYYCGILQYIHLIRIYLHQGHYHLQFHKFY